MASVADHRDHVGECAVILMRFEVQLVEKREPCQQFLVDLSCESFTQEMFLQQHVKSNMALMSYDVLLR